MDDKYLKQLSIIGLAMVFILALVSGPANTTHQQCIIEQAESEVIHD